jgi:hypothetical protein
MKNELVGKGFMELSADEAVNIGGGTFFSLILDSVKNAFPTNDRVHSVLKIIEDIAAPIFGYFGHVFRD